MSSTGRLFEASTLPIHEKHIHKHVLKNVELLSKNAKVVNMVLVDNSFKNGVILNQVKLFSTEVAIGVTEVICPSH